MWDFGSAARHHRLYAPWLPARPLPGRHARLARRGRRRRPASSSEAAREIRDILEAEGVADMPLGIDVVEPPLMFELQKLGIEVRDGQQTMLEAREIKNIDELTLLNMAAAMVDGVYQDIAEALKPGVRENDIVALATQAALRDGLRLRGGDQRDLGRALQPASAQLHRPLIRPGDQAFFDIIQSFMGYRTCYYRTFSVGRATPAAARRLQEGARVDGPRDRAAQAGRDDRQDRARRSRGAGDRLRERDGRVRPQLLPRPRPRPARAAAHLPAEFASTTRSS